MIDLLLWLAMMGAGPSTAYAAVAIATCESGDTVTFGSYDWRARSITDDGGAFQFNDATWKLAVGEGRGDTAHPATQTLAFVSWYNDGRGIHHWRYSKRCWAKWIDAQGKPTDTRHYDAFVGIYSRVNLTQSAEGAK